MNLRLKRFCDASGKCGMWAQVSVLLILLGWKALVRMRLALQLWKSRAGGTSQPSALNIQPADIRGDNDCSKPMKNPDVEALHCNVSRAKRGMVLLVALGIQQSLDAL